MLTERVLSETFHDSLADTRMEFVEHPLRFFSEKDLHWYFCMLLHQNILAQIPKKERMLVKTNLMGMNTMLIHQEFGTSTKGGKRFDVCLLDPGELGQVNNNRLQIDGRYAKPLEVVEFTGEYGITRLSSLGTKVENDAKKLRQEAMGHGHIEVLLKTPPRRSKLWLERVLPNLKKALKAIGNTPEVETVCKIVDIPRCRLLDWDLDSSTFTTKGWLPK